MGLLGIQDGFWKLVIHEDINTKGGRPSIHKKRIKDTLGCHGTFAEFESITSMERSETSQGSLWKGLYTALTTWRQVHTPQAFPCQSYSLCFIPPSTGPVTGKKHRKRKTSLCYYGNLRVIFRDRIFLGIINRHEQDLC